MQRLKRIIFLIAFSIIVTSLQVNAYSSVSEDDFLNVFPKNKFVSFNIGNGTKVHRDNLKSKLTDEYEYLIFEDSKQAKAYIIDSYTSGMADNEMTVELEKEFDVLNAKNTIYSILKYNYLYNNYKYYNYLYRYDNVIVFGTAEYELKSTVDKNMKKIETFNDPKVKTTEKNNKSLSFYTYLVLGLFSILLLIITFTVIGHLDKKNEKTTT